MHNFGDPKKANLIPHNKLYLSSFDCKRNGPIHKQPGAIKNMQNFHKSMKYKKYQYQIYHEAWSLFVKCKNKMSQVCSRCSCNKNTVKKCSYRIIVARAHANERNA